MGFVAEGIINGIFVDEGVAKVSLIAEDFFKWIFVESFQLYLIDLCLTGFLVIAAYIAV